MTDDPAITGAIDFLPTPFGLGDAQRLLSGEHDGRDCFWGIRLAGEDALVGTIGTHLRGNDEIEIGYWLASAARGRGIGAESAAGVVRALRLAYPARSIFAECLPQNVGSWRLLTKLGFKADGRGGLRAGRHRLVLIE